MSVLIRDMPMPKNCDECRIMTYEDTNCISVHELFCGCPIVFRAHPQHEEHRPDYCPLVEVEPHGRLIDADELMLKIKDYIEEYSPTDEHGMHDLKWCAMKETEMAINDAPTIIESEGEDEQKRNI